MSSLVITNNTLGLVLPVDQGTPPPPRFTLQGTTHHRDSDDVALVKVNIGAGF